MAKNNLLVHARGYQYYALALSLEMSESTSEVSSKIAILLDDFSHCQ